MTEINEDLKSFATNVATNVISKGIIPRAKGLAQKFGLAYKPGTEAPGWGGKMVYSGELKRGEPQIMHVDDWVKSERGKAYQKAADDAAAASAAKADTKAQEAANRARASREAEEARLKTAQENPSPEASSSSTKPKTSLVDKASSVLNTAALGGVAGVGATKVLTSKTMGDTAAAAAPENKPDITPKSVKTVPVKPDGSIETPAPAPTPRTRIQSDTPAPTPTPAPPSSQSDDGIEIGEPKKVKTMKIGPNGSVIQEQQAPAEGDRNRNWRLPRGSFDPTPSERQPNLITAPPETPAIVQGSEPRRVQTTVERPQAAANTATRTANTAPPAAANTATPTPPKKPAAAPAPKVEEPAPAPKSREMYQKATDMANRGENDTAAYWQAVAQHEKEQGRTAPNDFSDSAVGKFFSGLTGGKKKVDESIKYLSMNPSSTNMFAEAKKLKGDQYKLDKNKNGKLDSQDFKMLRGEKVEEAKKLADKDYDGDGKIESPKDEVWGSRLKAAKKAGKLEEGILKKVASDVVSAVKGMSAGEKGAVAAGGALSGAAGYGSGKVMYKEKPTETPKTEKPAGEVIQQGNNPTPRGAMDRIRDNLGLDSPDYSPKTDPNYKPKDTGPSDEDKEELNKKVKDAIKENYLHMLKRK